MNPKSPVVAEQVVEEFLGDVAPLVRQVGGAEGLAALGGVVAVDGSGVADPASLRRFLGGYQSRILFPIELPAIRRAFGHGTRYEVRELIALDVRLGDERLLQNVASASRKVGKTQLKRLRPLRDQRLVQRYLHAVQSGEAHGWHTVVYGLILSLYSLPLRQGLLRYARQTTLGFIQAASSDLGLDREVGEVLVGEFTACLPDAVNAVLAADGGPALLTT